MAGRRLPDRKPLKVARANYPNATELFEAGFPTRVRNALIRGGVETLAELEQMTRWDLLDIRNFGIKSLYAFAERMRQLDRTVDPEIFDWMNEERWPS